MSTIILGFGSVWYDSDFVFPFLKSLDILTFFLSKALSVFGLMRLSNLMVLLEHPPEVVVASCSAFSAASAAFLDIFFEVFSFV